MPRGYTVEVDGEQIPFEAPETATQREIVAAAQAALKAAKPNRSYRRPVLEERLRKFAPRSTGELTAAPDTGLSRLEDRATGALAAFGMDEGAARRRGNTIAGALADFTPVGAAVAGVDAIDAGLRSDYGSALGHGALAALQGVPDAGPLAKAMFLGVGAKNADLAALKQAQEMLAAAEQLPGRMGSYGAHRREIWKETGWFKGADDKWRFEVPDNEMRLDMDAMPNPIANAHKKANQYAQKRFGKNMLDLAPGSPERQEVNSFYTGLSQQDLKALGGDVISHPALYDAYPDLQNIGVAEERNRGLRGSWNEEKGVLRLAQAFDDEMRSTAAHELQHAVQGVEGFARGGMVGTIPAHEINPEITAINRRLNEIEAEKSDLALDRDWVTNKMTNEPRWHELAREQDELRAKLQQTIPSAEFEGYRRLAGEVEARNVQTRLDMTPGQRKEFAPWETEDVPRDMQFVLWHGDRAGALEPFSPLTDASGQPITVYRGDFPNLEHFGRGDPSNYIKGNIFFTDQPGIARHYAKVQDDWWQLTEERGPAEGLYKAHLSLKNPLVVDGSEGSWFDLTVPEFADSEGNPYSASIDFVAEEARKRGYDGMIVRNVMDQYGLGDQYVAFDPMQARLVK